MELINLKTAINEEQHQRNLQESQQTTTSKSKQNEISLYESGVVDSQTWAEGTKLIAGAFPALEAGWYNSLKAAVKDEKIGNQRFYDAVINLLKTYDNKFRDPRIADLISFDKKFNYLTYEEVAEKNLWGDVETIDVGFDTPRWAKKNDVENYGLKKWQPKQQK